MKRSFIAMMAGGLAAMVLAPSAALSQGADSSHQANLTALNGSGASGSTTVDVSGGQVTVTLNVMNVSGNLPHAQHIHIGGQNMCPGPSADEDGDGVVNTAEGVPFYGGVRVSLTTDGDASATSALAVDRMPAADGNGSYTYQRTFALPEGVSASDLEGGAVVVHGFSELSGDEAAYDGDATSPLDESLPLEATLPVLCGELSANPGMGAPETGTGLADQPAGDSAGLPWLLAGAAGIIAAGGAAGTVALRRGQRQ
ncbi:MAG: hypothetical protein U5Q44_10935 [Dehalococcoidia bacterium]|nr:hypothetical protein [Dehalococcoidia bacterium]